MTADFKTASQLSNYTGALFKDASLMPRLLGKYRPYIVPFEELLRYLPENADLLDIGCGSGSFIFLSLATGRINSAIGIEPEASRIELAQQIASANNNTNAQFIVESDYHAWPDHPFDCVSLIDVMHHIPPGIQKDFFRAACHHVKPGGVLIYKDMCRRPIWRAIANRLHDLVLARQWIHYAPLESIKQWADEEGLEVEASGNFSRFVYGHEMIIFKRPG